MTASRALVNPNFTKYSTKHSQAFVIPQIPVTARFPKIVKFRYKGFERGLKFTNFPPQEEFPHPLYGMEDAAKQKALERALASGKIVSGCPLRVFSRIPLPFYSALCPDDRRAE